ncbi:MAG: ATP-binding protein [Oscillospiraceae bacterium]|nr:ATP-binding protein [Oscillospiraceae bacterium]
MAQTKRYKNALTTARYALLPIFIAVVVFISGCSEQSDQEIWIDSYRDIPGITQEQIQAIEQLRMRYDYFLYGMIQNDEAFYTIDGEIAGFSARMSDWLTELFGIPFIPVIYDTIVDLMNSFESDTVHFTGQFPRIPLLEERYAMTDPISKRSVAIARAPGSRPLSEIERERELHILFIRNSALHSVLRSEGLLTNFSYTHVDTHEEAAELLLLGEADAYIGDGVFTTSVNFPGFRVEPFFPFVFGYATFSALNPDFIPIVDAVQKILDNGGMAILSRLYADGMEDAARHRISLLLTEEERKFITDNPVIPIAVHDAAYPISFFNEWEGEFQGIAIDVLRKIETITGMRFEIAHPDLSHLGYVHQLLHEGEVYLGTGPFRAVMQEDVLPFQFLFTDSFFTGRFTLVSYGYMPIVGINELLYMCVGLMENTIYDTVFSEMFPQHLSVKRFPNMDEPLDALENGEIDLIFLSVRQVLRANRLLERPGFRTNIVFDNSYDVSFAINENMPLLSSIIDKSLSIIDTEPISDFWTGKTFDFTVRVLQAQRPWFVGTVVSLGGILILSLFLFNMLRKRESMKHAEASNHAKTRFLARMSHEIRTPITSVMGISEIQLQSLNHPPETEESFAKIYDSSNVLLGIVNDILDLSKIEAGKLELLSEEYEVATLISDAVAPYIAHLEHKSAAFALDVDENLPICLIGDALRIKQIVNNILSNAFKYTESGTVTLSLGAERVNDDKTTLTITIQDTGLGMTPEQLSALFGDFTRFHGSKGSIIGTGLGMPIVYSLTQFMGAEIDVKSEVGKGTTVSVRIPQGSAGTEVIGSETAQSLQRLEMSSTSVEKWFKFTPEPMPYGKVLIVDDVDANLYVVKGLLAFFSINAETCESGYEAIEKIKSDNKYDIIFMDQMMPGMNGTETMQKLRDMGYNEPIVALTANALIGQADEFIKNGFDGFISKPVQTTQLNTILHKFIVDKQSQETIEEAKKAVTQNDISEYQNSEKVQSRLRIDFARRHRGKVGEIKNSISSGDIETAHRLAHTLKGTAGLIYETALSDIAQQIENILANGETPTDEQLTTMENELARVIESIGRPEQTDVSADWDKENILALLDKLEQMLADNNAESISLLDELRAIPEAAVLIRQIENFEFASARDCLSVLKDVLEER